MTETSSFSNDPNCLNSLTNFLPNLVRFFLLILTDFPCYLSPSLHPQS